MRGDDLDGRGEVVGAAASANGARAVAGKPQRWSVEEKIRVAQESLDTQETVIGLAKRYGISRYRLLSWRSLLRRGKLMARSSSRADPDGVFAAVEVEERHSVVIEWRGVTVRLERVSGPHGITAIAVALAGSR